MAELNQTAQDIALHIDAAVAQYRRLYPECRDEGD